MTQWLGALSIGQQRAVRNHVAALHPQLDTCLDAARADEYLLGKIAEYELHRQDWKEPDDEDQQHLVR